MAQSYGKEIEYVLFTSCENKESMDFVESTLITGFAPPLNKALKQFSDPSILEEATKLDERYNWEVAWGVGTVFWDTAKVCDQMKRGYFCRDIRKATDDLLFGLQKNGGGISLDDVFDLLEKTDNRKLAIRFLQDLRWCMSLAFMFDAEAYLKFVDEAEEYFDKIDEEAKRQRMKKAV